MTNNLDWLIEREISLEGQTILYSYDKEGDILEIVFQTGQGGIGVDLTENITLRYNRNSREPLSLLLSGFSHLIRPTQFGPPSFQLTALAELPAEMQQVVLRILNSFPVNRFLKLSGLRLVPGGELQPITYLTQPDELALDKVLA
ncbi:MAG: DUF2283 domain-containing protein [Anaerolineales bacterium]|nr:DUF2283 domain-containing protein [Anaerolineales bacterium]